MRVVLMRGACVVDAVGCVSVARAYNVTMLRWCCNCLAGIMYLYFSVYILVFEACLH